MTLKLHEPLAASVAPDRLTVPLAAVAVIVPPPHVPDNPLGVATTKPAGNVSVNATPVKEVLALAFVIVKVRDVVAFTSIVPAPNVLVIEGGERTIKVAVEVFPVPPLVEFTWTLFVSVPLAVARTLTLKLHEPLAAIVAPDKLTMPLAAAAVIVPPPHVPLSPLGVATTNPAGKLSVNATPVKEALALGFVIVKLKDVVPLRAMVPAPNVFVIEGGDRTINVAVEVFPSPPLVEFTWTLFVSVPLAVARTLTLKLHEPLAAIVAPDKLTMPLAAVAAIVPPPHVPDNPLGVATTKPAGNVSVNATPVKEELALGFVIVKLKEVVPFRSIVPTPKVFVIEGGDRTVSVAVEVLPVPPLVELTVTLLVLVPAVVPWRLR